MPAPIVPRPTTPTVRNSRATLQPPASPEGRTAAILPSRRRGRGRVTRYRPCRSRTSPSSAFIVRARAGEARDRHGQRRTAGGRRPAAGRTRAARPRRGCARTPSRRPRRRAAPGSPANEITPLTATIPQRSRAAISSPRARGEHRGAEAVAGGVGAAHGLVDVRHAVDDEQRPERLLGDRAAVLRDVDEHDRLDERRRAPTRRRRRRRVPPRGQRVLDVAGARPRPARAWSSGRSRAAGAGAQRRAPSPRPSP